MDRICPLFAEKRETGSGRFVSRDGGRGKKMAKSTVAEPAYVSRLAIALQAAFPGAQLTHEQIRRDRYRFIVVTDAFEDMGHPERQRLLWEIAEKAVEKNDLIKIGMIIAIAPSELP